MIVRAIYLSCVHKRHVRRDGTSQKHKYTCNFKYSKLDKLTSDPRQPLVLFDGREG